MAGLPLPLSGSRLRIRRPTVDDIEAWYDLEADPEVKYFLNGPTKHEKCEWVNGMRQLLPDGVRQLVVEIISTGAFGGRVALDQISWEIEVVIARTYWGKRLGEEAARLLIEAAFTYMAAPAVFAVIHPMNKASKKLFSKLGFIQNGLKETDGWDNGHLIFSLKKGASRAIAQ